MCVGVCVHVCRCVGVCMNIHASDGSSMSNAISSKLHLFRQ